MDKLDADAKHTVYIAGLDAGATGDSVHAAFIPFGEIRGVSVGNAGGTRFALVHFEEIGDACSAVENMNRAEMFGHVLRVSRANPANLRTQLSGNGGPIWDSEAWLQEYGALESNHFEHLGHKKSILDNKKDDIVGICEENSPRISEAGEEYTVDDTNDHRKNMDEQTGSAFWFGKTNVSFSSFSSDKINFLGDSGSSGIIFDDSSEVVPVSIEHLETGEEDEIVVFEGRAKLFSTEPSEHPQWKERGIGTLRLNVDKFDSSKARLVMRCDGTFRVTLNIRIFREMAVSIAQEKFVRFLGVENRNMKGSPEAEEFVRQINKTSSAVKEEQ